MSLRSGSLRGLEELDSLEVKALLDDYQLAKRRDHCSRQDFAAGWRAAKLRFEQGDILLRKPRKLKLAV